MTNEQRMYVQQIVREQIADVVAEVGRAIKVSGGVPNGVLYAAVMPSGLSLDAYLAIIALLKKRGLVKESNNFLTWVGPTDEAQPNVPVEPQVPLLTPDADYVVPVMVLPTSALSTTSISRN